MIASNRVVHEHIFLLLFNCILYNILGAVINNILLDRTCFHVLNYTKEECDLLQGPGEKSNDTKYIEQESQKYATIVTMVRSVIEAVFPAILSLFLAVWSDTYGRKPLVAWPLFGKILYLLTEVFFLYYIWLLPLPGVKSPWNEID